MRLLGVPSAWFERRSEPEMNVDKFFEDWYLIKNAAESGDDYHHVKGLYPALERFEETLNLIIYSDCMVNEHIYDNCLEGEKFSEFNNSCLNSENQNLNFPTIHPPLSSEKLKETIEYARILSAEWIKSLKK